MTADEVLAPYRVHAKRFGPEFVLETARQELVVRLAFAVARPDRPHVDAAG